MVFTSAPATLSASVDTGKQETNFGQRTSGRTLELQY